MSAGLAALAGVVAPICPGNSGAAQGPFPSEDEILKGAGQGEVVLLKNLWAGRREIPVLPVTVKPMEGPQLLFSDRPEYFRMGDGIALRETVKPGLIRLYIYHVPEPEGSPKVVSAVIENQGTNELHLRFLRRAFPKPSANYQEVGKQGLVEYFDSVPESAARQVWPGERMVIDPAMDGATAMSPQLVHGFYEFEIDQPALISVFQRSPGLASTNAAVVLPPIRLSDGAEGAGRGLFLTSEIAVTATSGSFLDSTNGAVQLLIADGRRDPWITGRDRISGGNSITNKGNYGVVYHIRLSYRSSDGRGLALLSYNPNGEHGGCGRLAMALQVSAGDFPEGIVSVPKAKTSFGGRNQMVLIQRFPPLPLGTTGTVEIVYSPPGASCLPTPLLFVPYTP